MYTITDTALAEELYPEGVWAIKQDRGIFDTFPLSLITTQTIASLGKSVGNKLTPKRFRPNFLVEAIGDDPYPEDKWVGKILCIGGLRMRIDKRDGRCTVITVDPLTTDKSPEILRSVYENRQGCLGVYGTPVTPGKVALYDEVVLEF